MLHVNNETSTLKTVVLGQPASMGLVPDVSLTYDAKSFESVAKGIYPSEERVAQEMSGFETVLKKYGVEVLRPRVLKNCNQVFARDVGFVIDDKVINSNIIPDREDEKDAYKGIFCRIGFTRIFNLPEKAHVEGGDVILCSNRVYVGVYTQPDYPRIKTARTNRYAFDFLKELFPEKEFIALELVKHDTNPYEGVLHLDCTFMPIGKGKAIIYPPGFRNKNDCRMLVDYFGKENVFEITREEMYFMNTNVFSISPQVVVSEQNFTRLNHHLEKNWGMTVEKIPYYEVSKMGGLLRCSTLPLVRLDD